MTVEIYDHVMAITNNFGVLMPKKKIKKYISMSREQGSEIRPLQIRNRGAISHNGTSEERNHLHLPAAPARFILTFRNSLFSLNDLPTLFSAFFFFSHILILTLPIPIPIPIPIPTQTQTFTLSPLLYLLNIWSDWFKSII